MARAARRDVYKRQEAARLLVDVEVVQESFAIAHHAKNAASVATASGSARSKVELGKMEHQRVPIAGVDGDGIGEMSVAFGRKQVGIR